MNIRTKFSVASGLIVFIILSLLSLSSYILVSNSLEKETKAYVEDNSSLLTQSISNWLNNKASQIHVVKDIIENPYLNGSVIRFDGALRMAAK